MIYIMVYYTMVFSACFLLQQGMPVDVDVCIYPPFFPDEDKESIMDKRGMCSRGIEILQYLVSTHRNKI